MEKKESSNRLEMEKKSSIFRRRNQHQFAKVSFFLSLSCSCADFDGTSLCSACREQEPSNDNTEEQMDVDQINNGVPRKLNLFNQRVEAPPQKLSNLSRCKEKKKSAPICTGKSISDDSNTQDQMDVDQTSNGVPQKLSLFKQISNGEEAPPHKFNLSRCQQKKKSVPICKGKSIMEPSNDQIDVVDQVMGIHFKEDIMMEILSRLPVRSLLRFKCVSKFWEALIADPYFKMKHHIHAKNDQNSPKNFICQTWLVKDRGLEFHCSSLSPIQMVEDEQKVDCPSNCIPMKCKPYCGYDGLILLVSLYDRPNLHLLLWNPSTRESIELPHPESPLIDCVWGLGYDATSDDYKVVAINLKAYGHRVEILSLKSGSWRRIGSYPTGVHCVSGFKDCGMDYLPFVHGAFHWLGRSPHYTIVSFNISNEVYGEIPLLERLRNMSNKLIIDHGVSVLGGMLCLYSTYIHHHMRTFELWVMKDYGVKESWTELITIRNPNLFYSARPKHLFADGEVLLRCQRTGSCGTVFRTTSRGPFGLWPHCDIVKFAIVYTESLISPKLLT
ncbi:F-box/kelch-repeat protein At3g23880-like isoform X2 [Lycium barbarum]|uniref:F-box/kelch-repeat protein At3g23880-like isoform X2 n=2 Tax=Lycium barbarum TaxID=112863 RepID=UPI00293E231E|nr:F-box/kelch-repeat protein At3g23880-like isoform X2 [Lycium barbarum]